MGRRARTNGCSPIDSALEKYHHDIGNRLSGVFVPPIPTPEEPSDFGMLTLDIRHKHQTSNLRQYNNTSGPGGKSSTLPLALEASSANRDDASAVKSSTEKCSSLSTPVSHSHSDSINSNNTDKRRLVDKVTRALFQRKHTCSRCQRRSRSCLPNKTFNGTEKHYMCGNCRENSHAIKHLFTVPLHKPTSEDPSAHPLFTKTSSHPLNHLHNTQQTPRKQLNDSGYDTATSCSTLSSAYSAFTTTTVPASEDAAGGKGPCPAMSGHHEEQEEDSGVQHFLAPDGVLREVRPKHTKDYDGYLPGSHHHHIEGGVVVLRSPLSDTTNSNARQSQQPKQSDSNITHQQQQKSGPKMCYTCGAASKPCFRLPWAGGWLCEDCMDAMC